MDKIAAVAAELRASLPKGEFTEKNIQDAAKWFAVNCQKKAS